MADSIRHRKQCATTLMSQSVHVSIVVLHGIVSICQTSQKCDDSFQYTVKA